MADAPKVRGEDVILDLAMEIAAENAEDAEDAEEDGIGFREAHLTSFTHCVCADVSTTRLAKLPSSASSAATPSAGFWRNLKTAVER